MPKNGKGKKWQGLKVPWPKMTRPKIGKAGRETITAFSFCCLFFFQSKPFFAVIDIVIFPRLKGSPLTIVKFGMVSSLWRC